MTIPTIKVSGNYITDNRTHTVHGSDSQTSNLNQNAAKNSQGYFNRKEIKPDYFDRTGETKWADYIIHFDQCSA